jgi:predicted nucleic acid-binding protein
VNFLLDTNVVSEWVRPRPEPRVVAWLANVDEDRVFLSVITLAELQLGIQSLPAGVKRARLLAWLDDELLQRFESRVIVVSAAVAREWGTVSALARRAGRPIGAMDAFVAATARVHGLALATRNDADFRDAGVELVNPWTS